MIRFCVACRTRKETHDLIAFHREEKELLLGVGRRSAWVCRQKKCLQLLEKNPMIAYRSLQIKDFSANTCLEQMQEKNKCDIQRYLVLSQRSGVVFSGPISVLQNKEKLSFLLFCGVSQEAFLQKKPTREYAQTKSVQQEFIDQFPTPIPVFYVDIQPQKIGEWIGKGKRKILGLSHNRHSRQLLKTLHQYKNLR